MNKTFKKIVTFILVLAMLFGVSATTLSAATVDETQNSGSNTAQKGDSSDSTGGENGDTVLGSAVTGWCDVEYTENGIVVTLSPDIDALKAINKEQITELFNIIVEAVKKVVVEDFVGQFVGDNSDNDSNASPMALDVDTSGVNIKNIWMTALESYVFDNYSDIEGDLTEEQELAAYLAFFKAMINEDDDVAVNKLADHICTLVKAAVISGAISVDELPKPEDIEVTLVDEFKNILDKYIEIEVGIIINDFIEHIHESTGDDYDKLGAMDKFVESYIGSFIETEIERHIQQLKDDTQVPSEVDILVWNALSGYLTGIVSDIVDEYIVYLETEGGTFGNDSVHTYVKKYFDSSINGAVSAYLKGLQPGETLNALEQKLFTYMDSYITSFVKTQINKFVELRVDEISENPTKVTQLTDAEKLIYNEMTELVEDYVDGIIDDYLAFLSDPTSKQIDARIKTEIDKYVANYFITNFDSLFAEYFANYKAYKISNPKPETKPEMYDSIEKYVRGKVVAELAQELYNTAADEYNSAMADIEAEVREECQNNGITDETYIQQLISDAKEEAINSDPNLKKAIEELEEYKQATDKTNTAIYEAANEAYAKLTYADWNRIFNEFNISEDPDDYRAEFIEDGVDEDGKSYSKVIITIPESVYESNLGNQSERQKYIDDIIDYVVSDSDAVDIVNDYIASVDISDIIDDELKNKIVGGSDTEKVVKQIIVYLSSNKKDENATTTLLDDIIASLDMAVVLDECLATLNDNETAAFIATIHSYFEDKEELHSLIIEVVKNLEGVPEDPDAPEGEEGEEEEKTNDLDKLLATIRQLVIEEAKNKKNQADPESAINVLLNQILETPEDEEQLTLAGIYLRVEDIAKIIAARYAEALKELEEKPEDALSYRELLKLINDFKINGESIVDFTENGVVFNIEALQMLFADIPTPSELATMSPEEMFLSYDIGIYTNGLGKSEFNLTVKLGGGYETANKIGKVLSETFDFYLTPDNKLCFTARVPAIFAELALRACNAGKIPDSIKHKVFDLLSTTPDDEMAFINNITLDELIELIDYIDRYVDFDGLLDKEFVSRFEKLDGLTYDEIKEKISEYEYYYDKAFSIINRAYSFVPEQITDKSLVDLYNGNGSFGISTGEYTFDLYKMIYEAITKVKDSETGEKYANLFASVVDKTSITLSAELTVEFADVAKIEYYVGNTQVKVGFLPKGADVLYFANMTQYEGIVIKAWKDADGNVVTTMPEDDIKLYADMAIVEAVISAKDGIVSKTYDGQPIILTAAPKYEVPGATLSYVWYKGNEVVSGATGSTLELTDVADSGSYRCEIVATVDGTSSEPALTDFIQVTINKKAIDLSVMIPAADSAWTAVQKFPFDNTQHGVDVSTFGVPAGVEFVKAEGDLFATAANNYTITAIFALEDSENYEFKDGIDSFEYKWAITPVIITEFLEWTPSFAGTAVYEYGTEEGDVAVYSVSVAVKDEYAGIITATLGGDYSESDVGNYTAIAQISLVDPEMEGNYSFPDSESYPWSIEKRDIDLSTYAWNYDDNTDFVYNENGNSICLIGLPWDIAQIIKYEGADQSGAGSHTAKAYLDTEAENYEEIIKNYRVISHEAPEQDWDVGKFVATDENTTIQSATATIVGDSFHFDFGDSLDFDISGLLDLPDDEEEVIVFRFWRKRQQQTRSIDTNIWELMNQAPTEAGEYLIEAVVSDEHASNYDMHDNISAQFVINPKEISLGIDKITLDETYFTYDGNPHTVNTQIPDSIEQLRSQGLINVSISADDGFSATDHGTYGIIVSITLVDQKNYTLSGETYYVLNWSIGKQIISIDADDVSLDTSMITPYTGNDQTVAIVLSDNISNLIASGKITITDLTTLSGLTGNAATSYTVDKISVALTDPENYEFETVATREWQLSWSIEKATVDVPELKFDYVAEHIYTGSDINLTVTHSPKESGVTFDENLFEVTYDLLGLVGKDPGAYEFTVTVSLKDTANYKISDETLKFTAYTNEWRIVVKSDPQLPELDLGKLTWSTDFPTFNGQEQTYAGIIFENEDNLQYVNVNYQPGTLVGTNAQKYTAVLVSITLNEAGMALYSGIGELDIESFSFEWEIKKAPLVITDITMNDKDAIANGKPHNIVIDGTLPDGVTVVYTATKGEEEADYENLTEIGTYVIIATFTRDDNYETATLSATLTIHDKKEYKTDDVIVIPDVWLFDYVISAPNVTSNYKALDFSSFAAEGKIATLISAFDISFKSGEEVKTVPTGEYIVKILIPKTVSIDGEFKVAYIAADNEITEIDAKTEGDYVTFTTDHFSVYAIVAITEKETPPCTDHIDTDGDGLCDNCDTCVTHKDENDDGICDRCEEKIPCDGNHKDADNDKVCDKCGEPMACGGDHYDKDEDGVCDSCGDCVTHKDENEDGKCDNCEECMEHKDADEDGKCDNCGEDMAVIECPGHIDEDKDGKCDSCGHDMKVTDDCKGHIDNDKDNKCDNCGVNMNVTTQCPGHADKNGDNKCDLCGKNMNSVHTCPGHVDDDKNGKCDNCGLGMKVECTEHVDKNGDGKCDNCGEDMPKTECTDHVDADGDGKCDKCGADVPTAQPKKDLTWLWILLAIIAVLIIVIIILLIIRRKKDDDEEPTEEPEPTTEPEPTPEAEETTEETVEEETVVEETVVEETVVEEPVVEEPVVEEPVVEETVVEEPAPAPVIIPVSADESEGRRLVNGVIVPVRYRTSFMSRLIQSEPPIQDYYTVVKNKLLSYKGVKARTSWNFESFNKGRIQCAKLNVKGSAFQVYLALDPNEYNVNKYHFVDVSDKPKLGDVPMMLKVKSDRTLKYTLELIEDVMNKNGIVGGEIQNVDYHMPYETTDALADRDLVKVILPAGMKIDENTIIEKVNVGDLLKDVKDSMAAEAAETPAPAEEHQIHIVDHQIVEEEIVHVDAVEADVIVSDELATEFVDTIVHNPGFKPKSSKCYEINLDTICENYEDGDTVTIDNLKSKSLIAKKAERIKVLARGTMSKKLTIIADKFSIQAVKMIGLAGGHVEKYKD